MNTKSLENLKKINQEELRVRLRRANYFKKWGGIMNYLIYHLDGFANLCYDHFINKGNSSQVFLNDFKNIFSNLKPEYVPSLTCIKKARKAWCKEYKGHIEGNAIKKMLFDVNEICQRRDDMRTTLFKQS